MFAGPASVVYVPRRSEVEVKAETKLELAFAHVPCDRDLPVKLITPDQVKLVSAGMANWRRDLRLYIPPGSAIGQRMILGETINPPSNWSGIPPHKHDEHSAVENVLEEFYLFKVKPANGDGVQLLMHNGQPAAHVVHNDDVAVLLDGYHPTARAAGDDRRLPVAALGRQQGLRHHDRPALLVGVGDGSGVERDESLAISVQRSAVSQSEPPRCMVAEC